MHDDSSFQYGNEYGNATDVASSFAVPSPVAGVLARLPAWPGSLAFAGGLNLLLAQHVPADVAEALRGRHLRIVVRDARVTFDFGWTGKAFAAYAVSAVRNASPDLTIAATAADFFALARREQDPDTLFFSRRLVMEGDTELGLMVKNMLDAMDLPVFDPRQWRLPAPRAVAGSVWAALRPVPRRQP